MEQALAVWMRSCCAVLQPTGAEPTGREYCENEPRQSPLARNRKYRLLSARFDAGALLPAAELAHARVGHHRITWATLLQSSRGAQQPPCAPPDQAVPHGTSGCSRTSGTETLLQSIRC